MDNTAKILALLAFDLRQNLASKIEELDAVKAEMRAKIEADDLAANQQRESLAWSDPRLDDLFRRETESYETIADLRGRLAEARRTAVGRVDSDYLVQIASIAARRVEYVLTANNKIETIKQVRERSGLGLRESKAVVDAWYANETEDNRFAANLARWADPEMPDTTNPFLDGLAPRGT